MFVLDCSPDQLSHLLLMLGSTILEEGAMVHIPRGGREMNSVKLAFQPPDHIPLLGAAEHAW